MCGRTGVGARAGPGSFVGGGAGGQARGSESPWGPMDTGRGATTKSRSGCRARAIKVGSRVGSAVRSTDRDGITTPGHRTGGARWFAVTTGSATARPA